MVGLKHSVLLVEDSSEDEALSKRAISMCGVPCLVQVIRHGGEAVTSLLTSESAVPDLVVLDFHMPGYNGLEILRAIRMNPKTRHIPVVLVSSQVTDTEISDCLQGGANSCVQKPIDPMDYVDHIALVVRYWLTIDKRPDTKKANP